MIFEVQQPDQDAHFVANEKKPKSKSNEVVLIRRLSLSMELELKKVESCPNKIFHLETESNNKIIDLNLYAETIKKNVTMCMA